MVLKYIDDFGSITPLEAMRDLGIYRLSARVWDIEHIDGIKLKHKTEASKNRYGKPIRYARSYRGAQDGGLHQDSP